MHNHWYITRDFGSNFVKPNYNEDQHTLQLLSNGKNRLFVAVHCVGVTTPLQFSSVNCQRLKKSI